MYTNDHAWSLIVMRLTNILDAHFASDFEGVQINPQLYIEARRAFRRRTRTAKRNQTYWLPNYFGNDKHPWGIDYIVGEVVRYSKLYQPSDVIAKPVGRKGFVCDVTRRRRCYRTTPFTYLQGTEDRVRWAQTWPLPQAQPVVMAGLDHDVPF